MMMVQSLFNKEHISLRVRISSNLVSFEINSFIADFIMMAKNSEVDFSFFFFFLKGGRYLSFAAVK